MRLPFFVLFLLAASCAFTIESYHNHATVLSNGDLNVYESMSFGLEQQFNEGFRSIRPADAGRLEDLEIHSVKVNGKEAAHYKQAYEGYIEIVWTETYQGANDVELNYTLRDKVELFDDFARVCYEHFGARWKAPAKKFSSRMSLPEAGRGRTMHFEIYSAKQGQARVDDLDIVVEMEDVPQGNYVGGCYLFERSAVSTGNVVEGSAYDILESERESYGSESVLEPESPASCFCVPVLILAIIFAAFAFLKRRHPRYPETILPPGKEEPAVVAALVRGSHPENELLAATIISLINSGSIDIIELEKEGELSDEIRKERTILTLKRRKGLKPHEEAVIDMLFGDSKEVDLDAMAKEFKGITSRAEAGSHRITKAVGRFDEEIKALLEGRKLWKRAGQRSEAGGWITAIVFLGIFVFLIVGATAVEGLFFAIEEADWLEVAVVLAAAVIAPLSVWYGLDKLLSPRSPGGEWDEPFERWDAFKRGLGSSRIREYPPSSVAIWGEILAYATALGLASKVKRHLSELDDLTMRRVEKLQDVSRSSILYYSSAKGVKHISEGKTRGGYSRRSSGGWSSGGGGGFSSGSSGGGGFR